MRALARSGVEPARLSLLSLPRRAKRGTEGKRRYPPGPGLGPRVPGPEPWEALVLWSLSGPRRLRRYTRATAPPLNFHPGRAPTQERRGPGDVTFLRRAGSRVGQTCSRHFGSPWLSEVARGCPTPDDLN